MRHALLGTSELISFAIVAFAAVPAAAQTTANGPYYAVPSWDQTLPASTRFIVLSNMSGQAVLDRETGLVWEKVPSTSVFLGAPPSNSFNSDYAAQHCASLTLGNRKGWHLPTIQELLTLVDPTQTNPALPAGHPFSGISVSDFYWTATASVPTSFGSGLRMVEFSSGGSGLATTNASLKVWCVRGGSGTDIQ